MTLNGLTLEQMKAGGEIDLHWQYPSGKVNYRWFNARIRLAAKAIYKHEGLAGLAAFWDLVMTPTWSNAEHMATGYGYTPNRCPFCGCPVPHDGKPLHYCDDCGAMLDAMIEKQPADFPDWKTGKTC